jgi:hypothetical protein
MRAAVIEKADALDARSASFAGIETITDTRTLASRKISLNVEEVGVGRLLSAAVLFQGKAIP